MRSSEGTFCRRRGIRDGGEPDAEEEEISGREPACPDTMPVFNIFEPLRHTAFVKDLKSVNI